MTGRDIPHPSAVSAEARLHVWEGLWHVFEWYPDIPEAQQSLDEIAAFLGGHLGRD